jgi:hypothetical protein
MDPSTNATLLDMPSSIRILFLAVCFVGGFAKQIFSQEPLRWLDWDSRHDIQTIVDQEEGQYLGHPTTVLLDDRRTILCVYPKGHGKGAIQMKRSLDGGRTWSSRLSTPASWATSLETPTIFSLRNSKDRRLVIFSGLYPIRSAWSSDDGATWTELERIGDFGGIVAMSSVVPIQTGDGHYMALFHDDGRFLKPSGKSAGIMTLLKSRSTDAGLTWSAPEEIFSSAEIHLCEPGAIRSPDGKRLLMLLRENRRVQNSHLMISDDEGATWSKPVALHDSLNGDRHVAKYLPDGRLIISFRDVPPKGKSSRFEGDWVAWVGTWEDILERRPGSLRIRLKDNHHKWDCAYPAIELMPDDMLVMTTYGHWEPNKPPYILSLRFPVTDLK